MPHTIPISRRLARDCIACFALVAGLMLINAASARCQTTHPEPGLAPTPPMGWANWNHFFCDYDDQTVREQADALVATGMRDLGYKYVLIQECIAPRRDASGELVVDPVRFPHGMKDLVNYIHSLGLKAGTYTDIGPYTCFSNPRYQGSYGHEGQDARTFAAWGMDFVEMDYCNRVPEHTGREVYERMAAAIQDTGRPMLFYICSWGNERPWTWAQGKAQLWRIDADISSEKDRVEWANVVQRFESGAREAVFSAPNSWNDPDMLEVGNRGLNAVEAQTHFAMWAISAAPLWAGNDVAHMTQETKAIYTNAEVIAIDQDPLGAGVVKVKEDAAGLEVWSKPLGEPGSGTDAVLLLNLTDHPATVSLRWSELNLSGEVRVHDLYAHRDLQAGPESFQEELPAHGSLMLKVSGTYDWRRGVVYEAEWPGNVRSDAVSLLACPECSQGYAISMNGTGLGEPAAELQFNHVAVPEPGSYQLTVVYTDSPIQSDDLQLQVNQGPAKQIHIHDRVHGFETFSIPLNQGVNSLRFLYADDPGRSVNIDWIRISR